MSTPNIFNVFASESFFAKALHNVQLLDVRRGDNDCELLTVECQGVVGEITGGRWHEQLNSRDYIGRFGELVHAKYAPELPENACYFRAYPDPTLRRAPELDAPDVAAQMDGRAPCVIGWRCEARPRGFRAPVGLIPGENGGFVPDETISVTLRVPPEFVLVCRSVRMTPEQVLRSFVGDLAGIMNWNRCPRADEHTSNGSDERDMAEAWLDRAHGMDRVSIEELAELDDKFADDEADREDIGSLVDDWKASGGNADELYSAIEALIEQKRLSVSEKA